MRILREGLSAFLLYALFEKPYHLLPIVRFKIGVQRVAAALLVLVENFFKTMMSDAEHHVGVHGDEAAITVEGKAPVAGFFGKRGDGRVVETKIENGVHHARHRGASAGPHGDKQRI